jgi:hypothetical protein
VVAGRTQISLWHRLAPRRRRGLLLRARRRWQCYRGQALKAPSVRVQLADWRLRARQQERPLARASALPTPARALVPVPSLRDPAHSDPAQDSHERARGLVERVVVLSSGSVADSAAVQRMVPARQGLATQRPVAGWRGPCTHRTTIGPSGEV